MEINELEQIALAGDVDLQYKWGMMYEEENDVKKAIDFLRWLLKMATLYLLNKKEEAVPYLHMAYELDSETIFDEEDPVFIELARNYCVN